MDTSTSILCIVFGLLMTTSTSLAQPEKTDFEDFRGTWEYNSPEAPYAYQEGQFVIAKKGGEPSVDVIFSDKAEVQAENIVMKDDELIFSIKVDGEYISVTLTKQENKIVGVADTPDGPIDLVAVRE